MDALKGIIILVLAVLLIIFVVFFALTRIELSNQKKDAHRFALDVNDRAVRLIVESVRNTATIRDLKSDRYGRDQIIQRLEIGIKNLEDEQRKRQAAYNAIRGERDQLAERIERAERISREELEIIKQIECD